VLLQLSNKPIEEVTMFRQSIVAMKYVSEVPVGSVKNVHGQWLIVNGQWSTGKGQWSMVMVNGEGITGIAFRMATL
jgi:hypothetical protein